MTAKHASSRTSVSSSLALGMFATGWSAIVSIVSIRWYVGLLGIESYGLIGFFVTLQAAIAIFELGLGATVNREVARSVALDDVDGARRLLHSLEKVYWAFALVIAVAVVIAAPLIADGWLGSSKLPRETVLAALRTMGVIAALRWPIGLYQGALIGLHRAQITYRANAVIATLGNVGAVLILSYVVRSLWAYFLWQAIVAVLWVGWMRRAAWRELGRTMAARFDRALLRSVLIASATMSGVATSGLVLTQLDKVTVSSTATLADFGRYALAGVLASGLSVLFIPTFNVIYPRLSALVAAGNQSERIGFYRLGTRLFLSCLFPIALTGAAYAGDVLLAWTGDASLARATAPIAALLILGSMLNGVMHFPYALQLAAGRTRLPLAINGTLIAVMLPLTVLLVSRFGAVGGGMAWLTLNALYFIVGVTVTHRYILRGLLTRWLFADVAPALLVSAVVVTLGHRLAVAASGNPFARLLVATLISLAITGLLVLLYPDARALARRGWQAGTARLRGRGRNTVASRSFPSISPIRK